MSRVSLDTAAMRRNIASLRTDVGEASRWAGYARGLRNRTVEGLQPGSSAAVARACSQVQRSLEAMVDELGPHVAELERRRRRLEALEAETAAYQRAADHLNASGFLGIRWGFGAELVKGTGSGLADVLVLDHVQTLRDDDASWGAKGWAAFNLVTVALPVGKIAQAAKLTGRGARAMAATRPARVAHGAAARVPGVTATARGARQLTQAIRASMVGRVVGRLVDTLGTPARAVAAGVRSVAGRVQSLRGAAGGAVFGQVVKGRLGWEASKVRAMLQRANSSFGTRFGTRPRPAALPSGSKGWRGRLAADDRIGNGMRQVLELPLLPGAARSGALTHHALRLPDQRARWPAFSRVLEERGILRHEFVDRRTGNIYREYDLRDIVGTLPDGRSTHRVTVVLGPSRGRGGSHLPLDVRPGSMNPFPAGIRENVGPLFAAGVGDDLATVWAEWHRDR